MKEESCENLEELRMRCRKLENSLARFQKLAFEINQLQEENLWEFSAAVHDRLLQILNIAHLVAEKSLTRQKYQSNLLIEPETMTELRDHIAHSIEEAQSLMHALSSPVLKYLGLAPALHWLAEKVSSETKLLVQVKEESTCPRLPEHIKRLVFAAARQVLRCAEHSSDVSEFKLSLSCSDTALRLRMLLPQSCEVLSRIDSIWENPALGPDFHIDASSHDSIALCLACIREQCRFLGGNLEKGDLEGSAVVMVLSLPL